MYDLYQGISSSARLTFWAQSFCAVGAVLCVVGHFPAFLVPVPTRGQEHSHPYFTRQLLQPKRLHTVLYVDGKQ